MLDMWYEAGSPDGTRKVFRFQLNNNRINKGDIRDYAWTYDEKFNRVRQFYHNLETRSIPVTFFQRIADAYAGELYQKPEDMYAMFDRDVRMLTMGKLWIGHWNGDDKDLWWKNKSNYYVNCYIIGSSKKKYDNEVVIAMDLTVLSDFRWHRRVEKSWGTSQSGGGGGQGYDFLDFSYDHDFDYSGSFMNNDTRGFASDSISAFDFRIEFQGPIENPELQVGDNIYRVYTTLDTADEVLVIDSLERRVYRIRPDGEVNEFNNRDRDHYIFAPMPVTEGQSQIIYPVGHAGMLYAYIERSEPKWT